MTTQPDQPPPPGRRLQFRMSKLLLAMALVSVPAALFGGFLRQPDQGDYKSWLVLLTLMAPVVLIALFGLLRLLLVKCNSRRKW